MAKKHISQKFSFKGILPRNSTYRVDCRGKLAGIGVYDDAANILNGIQKRDAEMNRAARALVGGHTQAARVPGYTFNYTRPNGRMNFTIGRQPYHNEAHHVIPVEVFYDAKWTTPHLHIVKSAKENPDDKSAPGYNINNQDNIIILLQRAGSCTSCTITCSRITQGTTTATTRGSWEHAIRSSTSRTRR